MAKHGALLKDGKKGRSNSRGLKAVRAGEEKIEAAGAAKRAPELDRLIHERLRLGIISALAANDALTFNDLKTLMRTSDGNLSVHARKLEDAGYVVCTKSFDGRMPKTEYRITPAGRRALGRYLDHMEALIQAMRDRS